MIRLYENNEVIMRIKPMLSKYTNNQDTKEDQLINDLYIQLKLNYYEKMLDLSRIEMHEDLELFHYFGIHIFKENDGYRVITGRGHLHEIYKGEDHYGDAFIIDQNKEHLNPRMNLSCYEKMEMDKIYKTIDIPKIVFDFNQLFKDIEKERIALEIILI
jgi:hypothetical protein